MTNEILPPDNFAAELLRMAEAGRAMRAKAQSNEAGWDHSVDQINTERLEEMLAVNGWPTISKVEERSSNAAWLIAQHSDNNPAFQQKCLDLMKYADQGDVRPTNVAYLEDRVRVNTGRPQLYGTQFFKEGDIFGPRPIENEGHIEERRASVGLEPYKVYYEGMMKRYG